MDYNPNHSVFSDEPNIQDPEIVSPDIVIFRKALPEYVCKHILNRINIQNCWSKSKTVGEHETGVDPSASPRQSQSIFISDKQNLKDIDNYIHKVFISTLDAYTKCMGRDGAVSSGISCDEGYTLLKYDVGGFYKEHIDHSNNANIPRIISALLYLNDNFEGGETYFPRQNTTVSPKTGDIVFFPSIYTHPHIAQPVKDGTKYCIVSWWR